MAKYACVRTDNMSGTIDGSKLVSAKFYNGSDEVAAIQNGNVVKIGALIAGEREVRKATAPAANTPISEVALVASVEQVKDKNYFALSEFINEAGSIIRGYRFVSGNAFSVTKEALNGSAFAVGDIVELMEGTKFNVVKSATEGATKVGTIIAIEDEYYVVEVA